MNALSPAQYLKKRGFTLATGARFFGVSESTYQKYVYLLRYPSAKNQQVFATKSGGEICLNAWNNAYQAQQQGAAKVAK